MTEEVSLRDYFERVLSEFRVGHAAEHAAMAAELVTARAEYLRQRQEALDNLNERLDRLNDLRTEVIEDRGQFVRKDALEFELATRDKRVAELESWRSKAIGAGAVMIILVGGGSAALLKALGG